MKAYTDYVPTMFFFGRNCLKEKGGDILSRYGKRAYIVPAVSLKTVRTSR